MGYYSEIANFDKQVGPVHKKVDGRSIYAKRFTARAAAEHQGLITKLAVSTKMGHMDGYEEMCSGLKWFIIKNSLCDDKGELISNADLKGMQGTSDAGLIEFIQKCYEHCQVVNETGIHGRKVKDKDGKEVKDEETGEKK